MMRRWGSSRCILPFLVLMTGCAGHQARMLPAIRALEAGAPDRAVALVDRDPDPGSVLWQMERGLLLRAAGRYQESNEALAAAAARQDELYTHSVSNEAAALAVSDALRPYRAPLHELPFLHFYAALNYLDLGDREGAAVEARALSGMLEDRLRPGEEGSADDWGFGRLFCGLILEAQGEWNDAWIAYRAAQGAYEAQGGAGPELAGLVDGAVARTAILAGIEPGERTAPPPRLVVVVEEGLAPPLEEFHLRVPILREEADWGEDRLGFWSERVGRRAHDLHCRRVSYSRYEVAYLIDLALPFYPPRPDAVAPPPEVEVTGCAPLRAVLAEDVESAARRELDRAFPGIAARAAGRAIIKALATRAAEKKSGEWAGRLTNLLGVVSERADTRSWITLPERISLVVAELPPELESVRVVCSARGKSVTAAAPVPEAGVAFVDCRLLP